MKEHIKVNIMERAEQIAHYIIHSNATVRDAAKYFGISKSTVHAVVMIKNDCG